MQFEGKMELRVAVDVKGVSHLRKLDISQAMEQIVYELCQDHQVPYTKGELALCMIDKTIDQGTKYLSDENKFMVPPGSLLVLKESVTKKTEDLMRLVVAHNSSILPQLDAEAEDTVVLQALHAFGAHEHVFKILEEHLDASVWVSGLSFIRRLFTKRLIRKVPMKIVYWLFATIARGYEAPKEFVLQCLWLLSDVRRYGRLRYTNDIFNHLAALLLQRNEPEIQEASLQLLNFLVLFANNPTEENEAMTSVVNQKIVGCICDNILRGTPSKGMQQQLYRYQTLVLRSYWHKKVTKISSNDPLMESVRKLTHQAKKGELTGLRRRVMSEGDDRRIAPNSPRSGFLGNLKSSFRWSRAARPQPARVFANELFIEQGNTVPAPTIETLPPKSKRKGPMFYSCINSSEQNDNGDEISDVKFNFYGPILVAEPPSREKNVRRSMMKKAASASNLTLRIDDEVIRDGADKDPIMPKKALSKLTLNNLIYQATHNADQHRIWAVTKDQNYIFADQLTNMVCRLLEVGRPRPPDDPGDGYHPLVFFTYPYVLEELFCEACSLYERTRKEMRARDDHDVPKVLNTVLEQLTCALNPKLMRTKESKNMIKPVSMDQLREVLPKITYRHIAEKRRQELDELLKHDLANKPLFLEYREQCRPTIQELIRKQRLLFIIHGQHLPKLNEKGEIQKHFQVFLGLNKKQDHLLLGDCKTAPKKCDHRHTIPVEDIVDISIGKKSKLYRDIFNQNEHWLIRAQDPPDHYNLLFSLKMKDGLYYNFCAPDLKSLHYWTDAFLTILGKPMSSPTMEVELEEYLDLEVRLHFLDVEGLPIPDEPPPVPPPPPNYGFMAREKKKRQNSLANFKTAGKFLNKC